MNLQGPVCVFLLTAALLGLVVADESDPGDVVVLTKANFDSKVRELTKGDSALLVEFYAPWCGHCKSLEPKYKEAATQLLREDPPLRIAKMDADDSENKEIASKYGVSGFPTLKVFKDEGLTVLDYRGGREKDDIVKAVKNAQGPSWQEVTSIEEVDAKVKEGARVVLFAGKEPRSASKAFAAFKSVAAKVKGDYEMLAAFDKEVAVKAGLDPPAIQVITNYKAEGVRKETTSNALNDEDQVEKWLARMGKPLAVTTSEDEEMKFLAAADLPVLHVVVDHKDASRKNMFRNRLTKVAGSYKGKLAFAVTDSKERTGSTLIEDFALSTNDLPYMVIQHHSENAKYKHQKKDGDQLKVDSISAFADDFLAGGRLEKHIKSEAIPSPASKDDPVQVVVGKNFEEIVMDKSKNVLLEMYAPWCGHCKKLEPEYKAAAKKLWKLKEKNPERYGSIVLAKMDATANDSPVAELQARGYPTIKFIKAGENKIVDFSGERDSKSIVDWVKQEAV